MTIDSSSTRTAGEPGILDFGPVVLIFTRDEKVIVQVKGESKHLTIHLGGRSGVLDAHLTDGGEHPSHRTLGGLRLTDLGAALEQAQPTLERILERLIRRTIRRVRFGWLRHQGLLAFRTWPSGPEGLYELGHRRGRRWRVDLDLVSRHFAGPLTRLEVEASTTVAYFLIRRGAVSDLPYGILFKLPFPDGSVHYCWVKTSRMLAEIEKLWIGYRPLVEKYLLTPDEALSAIDATRVAQPDDTRTTASRG